MALTDQIDLFFDKHFPAKETAVFRDLSLNLKKILDDSSPLETKDRLINMAAISRSLHWKDLETFTILQLKEQGVGDAEIEECFEAAAIMGMLNIYYKFKSFLSADVLADTAYQRVGLRMNSLSKPLIGKEKFEMMAFAVSVVNGCETCVASHEKALTDIGVGRDKIHELARLASVLKGISCLHSVV
jgi:lipoyl-dependent peroxiredoxin subunit D